MTSSVCPFGVLLESVSQKGEEVSGARYVVEELDVLIV